MMCAATTGQAALLLPMLVVAGAALAQPEVSTPDPTLARQGQTLLAQYQCGSCHAIPGVPGARGNVAQPLSAWGRRSYIAGRLPNRADVLVQWIVDPQALVPGTAMPAMGVTPDEARAMAAYLGMLR